MADVVATLPQATVPWTNFTRFRQSWTQDDLGDDLSQNGYGPPMRNRRRPEGGQRLCGPVVGYTRSRKARQTPPCN
jgi:hypothetical protein